MIPLGSLQIHPHPLFESLGYFLGFRLYLRLRRGGDHLKDWHRLVLLAAAICGGTAGSKLLAWLEDPARTLAHVADLSFLLAGKSIVGGLVGGLIAVELVKRWINVHTATGDLYALPLILGMAIGRVGCFLSGLEDETHGVATALPWGIDFGDGIIRHPMQLYEIAFLTGLAAFIIWRRTRPHQVGDLFKCFMVGYLLWRFLADFIKPYPDLALGLGAIQLVCVAALIYYAPHVPRLIGVTKPAHGGHTLV